MLPASQSLAHDHPLTDFDSGQQARRFYLSRGFIPSPVKPMTLCLMLATVEQALREP